MVGDGTCPITDTWWQTETGMFQITTVPSMPLKPGAAGRPVAVVDEEGNEVPAGKEASSSPSERVSARSGCDRICVP
ncbi:acetyl-coenzyme A synthetase [Cutibacterium acnes JCM 18918]|nr:acetyl-coenzyme A synthetase [Cutibacterium acnes JCM 18918]